MSTGNTDEQSQLVRCLSCVIETVQHPVDPQPSHATLALASAVASRSRAVHSHFHSVLIKQGMHGQNLL